MLCQEIIELLEEHSPPEYALSMDNVGLLAGRRQKEVGKLLIALDPTDSVIEQAKRQNADMLLTHHPLIFSPRKSVTEDDIVGRRLVKLIQSDISYYAMHTNFDVRGMAELSAKKLELKNVCVLEETEHGEQGPEGIGRCGTLKEAMTLRELAEFVKKSHGIDYVRVCGDLEDAVTRVAISGGSGKSMVAPALKAGVQVLISGDLDHHTVLDAKAEGLHMIDAGHYGTEKMFVPYMKQYLHERTEGLEIMEAVEQDPYTII